MFQPGSIFYTLLFNGWFLVYLTWLQPPLMARLGQIADRPDIALGVGLALAPLIELAGVWLKHPAWHNQPRAEAQQPMLGLAAIGIAILAHLGLVTFLFSMTVLRAWGIDLRNDPPLLPGLLALAFFGGMIAREGLLLEYLMKQVNASAAPDAASIPGLFRRLHQRAPGLSILLGDALLTIFASLAYTVIWERLAADTPFVGATLREHLFEYLGAVTLFCLIFPATRPLSVIETWLTPHSPRSRLVSAASFVATMIVAILGIKRA